LPAAQASRATRELAAFALVADRDQAFFGGDPVKGLLGGRDFDVIDVIDAFAPWIELNKTERTRFGLLAEFEKFGGALGAEPPEIGVDFSERLRCFSLMADLPLQKGSHEIIALVGVR
jgi:hypothetical protein